MPGQPLRSFACFDFSGGLDVQTAPTVLAAQGAKNKWLTKASNVVFNDDGSVSKRWGMVQEAGGSRTSPRASWGASNGGPRPPPPRPPM